MEKKSIISQLPTSSFDAPRTSAAAEDYYRYI